MTCFVCLQPGGMQDACPCPASAVHGECLADFLKSDFPARCPNCCARFFPTAVMRARRILWRKDPTTPNMLKLAHAQLDAEKTGEALPLLWSAAPVPQAYQLAFDVECSRALMQTGQTESALERLTEALRRILIMGAQGPPADLGTACRAVVLMGRAHMSLGEYGPAGAVTRLALKMIEAEEDLPIEIYIQAGG